MKRVILLATAALVAMLMLVPTAMAQEGTGMMGMPEDTIIVGESTIIDEDLPQSGGPSPSVLLPATALIVGSGVLAFAVLRRR